MLSNDRKYKASYNDGPEAADLNRHQHGSALKQAQYSSRHEEAQNDHRPHQHGGNYQQQSKVSTSSYGPSQMDSRYDQVQDDDFSRRQHSSASSQHSQYNSGYGSSKVESRYNDDDDNCRNQRQYGSAPKRQSESSSTYGKTSNSASGYDEDESNNSSYGYSINNNNRQHYSSTSNQQSTYNSGYGSSNLKSRLDEDERSSISSNRPHYGSTSSQESKYNSHHGSSNIESSYNENGNNNCRIQQNSSSGQQSKYNSGYESSKVESRFNYDNNNNGDKDDREQRQYGSAPNRQSKESGNYHGSSDLDSKYNDSKKNSHHYQDNSSSSHQLNYSTGYGSSISESRYEETDSCNNRPQSSSGSIHQSKQNSSTGFSTVGSSMDDSDQTNNLNCSKLQQHQNDPDFVNQVSNLSVNSPDVGTDCPEQLRFPECPQNGFFGPYLRFNGTKNLSWTGSVLVVTSSQVQAPRFSCSANISPSPIKIASHFGLDFHRYDLEIRQTETEQKITYKINENQGYQFTIPGKDQTWKFMFTSCNGFSLDVTPERQAEEQGIQPLWRDVLKKHSESNFHVHVGGGDQLYCDEVFKLVPELKNWIEERDIEKKKSSPFDTMSMKNTERYYIMNYLKHFGQDVYKDAIASIPYIFNADDHDTFDGYGSYPEDLQNHPIMAGVGSVALKFYLLFQHHTTAERARQEGYFGEKGFNFIRNMGHSIALLGIDTRTERSLHHIASTSSWKMIERNLQDVPRSVKHLITVVGIPVAYPRIKGECMLETAAEATNAVTGFLGSISNKLTTIFNNKVDLTETFRKSEFYKNIVNDFGQSELMDDLNDHWTSEHHEKERLDFIDMLVTFAKGRKCRSTILAGDVHCGGISQFQNPEKQAEDDPTFISNIISSGIGNIPPPPTVIAGLHHVYKEIDTSLSRNGYTKEKMQKMFEGEHPYLIGRRNWCILEERRGDLAPQLRIELRVEGDQKVLEQIRGYEFIIPPLISC